MTAGNAMRRAVLNLTAVRASCSARPTAVLAEHQGSAVSRRHALGLAGVAVAGAAPALRAVETLVLGSYTLAWTAKRRLAFSLGGQERWVIDTGHFAGAPRLTVAQSATGVRVELRGARYPGTDLLADFRCVIHQGATVSRMTLRMALGGFSGSVQFEPWLAGLASLRSAVQLRQALCPLSASASLLFDGPAEATYAPDWTTELHGTGMAMLRGLGAPLTSDAALLSVLPSDAPSMISAPSPKRAAIILWRGDHGWPLQPAFQQSGHWRLEPTDTTFDAIRLELGEDGAARRRGALVAEAGGALPFYPHHSLKGPDGAAFSLGLSGARYVVAFDASGDHTALWPASLLNPPG